MRYHIALILLALGLVFSSVTACGDDADKDTSAEAEAEEPRGRGTEVEGNGT